LKHLKNVDASLTGIKNRNPFRKTILACAVAEKTWRIFLFLQAFLKRKEATIMGKKL
jgi:hypothetical protein